MASTIKTFEQVRQYLSDIPYINRGGCGIAALAMARWLLKNNGQADIMFFMGYNNTKDFLNNTRSVYDNQMKNTPAPIPVAPSHAGVVIEMYGDDGAAVVDTDGKLNLLRFSYTHTFYNEDIIVQAVNNIRSWNPAFNRNNVKLIVRNLGIDLSDIDLRTKAEFRAKKKPIFYKQRKKHLVV